MQRRSNASIFMRQTTNKLIPKAPGSIRGPFSNLLIQREVYI